MKKKIMNYLSFILYIENINSGNESHSPQLNTETRPLYYISILY